ncbi:MAG: hypothetical protein ACRDVG_14045 [Jatrophihabitantaceae bacterium]
MDARPPSMALARAAALSQLLVGSALCARPVGLARAVGGSGSTPRSSVTRVLGARSLVQGAVIAIAPTRLVLRTGAGIDITHALSLIPLVLDGRYRRVAAASVAVATVSAAVELAAAQTTS